MKRNTWCCLLAAFSLGFLASCQNNDEVPEASSQEVVFRVVNYMQYSLDEITRAVSADSLDRLVLGIFDAETDAQVNSLIVQEQGSTGYGTFSVKLTKGSYRLVIIGYDGKKTCQMTSSSAISFEDNYVPQTFLYSTVLTVGDDPIPGQDVVLKRAVGAFRLLIADALPSNLSKIRFTLNGGSTTLNGQTGFAVGNAGRVQEISIRKEYLGTTDMKVRTYVFLPAGETEMDITVDALTANGSVIRSRTFPAVPMKINTLLTYEGEFFAAASSNMSASVTVDTEWNSEVTVPF